MHKKCREMHIAEFSAGSGSQGSPLLECTALWCFGRIFVRSLTCFILSKVYRLIHNMQFPWNEKFNPILWFDTQFCLIGILASANNLPNCPKISQRLRIGTLPHSIELDIYFHFKHLTLFSISYQTSGTWVAKTAACFFLHLVNKLALLHVLHEGEGYILVCMGWQFHISGN